ncbi:SIR2 family NAD-dependent protein deacylase [Poseidonibacter sp.]|uniref:SIR2 family NAD-dependent protein deacylase n=1 Tax=Poseidonibacter sp. TaxID=2321188 RepID=UPI003C7344D3
MAKVIILTGSGISNESGIPTFRDIDRLWDEHKIEDISENNSLNENRNKIIEFYDEKRFDLKDKTPNYAHKTIAKLKDKYKDDIAIITQNVDDMFEKAGCNDVLHLHGILREIRCEECDFIEDIKYEKLDISRTCPKCQAKLRPNIVFFTEEAHAYKTMFKEFEDCQMLVVIGTSGAVVNTDYFLSLHLKKTILNNLETSTYIDEKLYDKVLFKKATLAIDEIAEDIEEFLLTKKD